VRLAELSCTEDDEQGIFVVFQLGALMGCEGILDGQVVEAELLLHFPQKRLVGFVQPDPDKGSRLLENLADIVERHVANTLAAGVCRACNNGGMLGRRLNHPCSIVIEMLRTPTRPVLRIAALCGLLGAFEPAASSQGTSPPSVSKTPKYGYTVVNSYPHDPKAYTQGLEYSGGVLYESTGLKGQSAVRQIDLATGKVAQEIKIHPQIGR